MIVPVQQNLLYLFTSADHVVSGLEAVPSSEGREMRDLGNVRQPSAIRKQRDQPVQLAEYRSTDVTPVSDSRDSRSFVPTQSQRC